MRERDTLTSATKPTPFSRNDFKVYREIATRWMDVDIYGHVNNVQYLSFFDTAVNGWYIDNGLLDPATSREIFLVVETGCQYFSELIYPETITAGIGIEKVGSSSVVYKIALFRTGMDTAAAQGRFVHVLVDRGSRRPIPINDEKRAMFAILCR